MTHIRVTEVQTKSPITKLELRIEHRPPIDLRNRRAELHLLATAVEVVCSSEDDWSIWPYEDDGRSVVEVEFAAVDAARARAMVQALKECLRRGLPRFPLAGKRVNRPSPFLEYKLKATGNGEMSKQLLITPPESNSYRQRLAVAHLLVAAVVLAMPVRDQWTVGIRDDVYTIAVEIALVKGGRAEGSRAVAVLKHVVARCYGAPMSGIERLAVPVVEQVWPAFAEDAWVAPFVLQLWT